MSARYPSLALSLLGLLALPRCGGEPTASTASAPASARPATSPSATSAGSAPASAPAASQSAPTAPTFVESPEPALAEWATSKVVGVKGSSKNACETRMVREWLRVQCVNRSPERGVPSFIEVTRGRKPKERYQGENLKVVNDITTLIVPVRPGIDFAATFAWEKGSDELTVRWPVGAPESAREMVFASATVDAPPDSAAPAPSATSGSTPAPAAEPAPKEPEADLEGLEPAPSAEDWAKAPEARVKGSTAAGCETKLVGKWFRARCEAKGDAKPVQKIVPLEGHKKTQTTTSVEGNVATFLTPYVEGTETHARFVREGESHVLVLRFPKGKQPETIGAFEKPR